MFELFAIISGLFFSRKIQHLLVVFQNNHELRGGGGFITQLLDISIGRGKLSLNFRHDHLDLKNSKTIESPEEIKRYLGHQYLPFRDSNIFPDFSQNAKSINASYQSIYPANQTAGVIAINFTVLEKLLFRLGNIKINGRKLNSQNLFSELTITISDVDHHDLQDLNQRKSVLSKLFSRLIKTILLRFWCWPSLYSTVKKCLYSKDIQIHFFDQKVQGRLFKAGMAEQFSSLDAADCLAIVENNYLGLKSNRYLRRQIFHDVKFFFNPQTRGLTDALIKVKIRTEHFGSYNYPLSGKYQSVSTVFFPKKAENFHFLTPGVTIDRQVEAGFQSFTYHKLLSIGESFEFEYQYTLPALLFQDASYSFRFIKQSGCQHEHIFETISYPDQYHLSSSNVSAAIMESKMFTERINVDQSFSYQVKGSLHLQKPRIFFHEIINPTTIQLRFNEPVQFIDNSLGLRSIKISDQSTSKTFKVSKMQFANDNRHLFIHLPTLPTTPERFYQVHLTNLQNQAGIPLSAQKPKKVTVVYRPKYFQKN